MPWWGELIYFIGSWITLFPILIGLYRLKSLDNKNAVILIWMCSMFAIQLYSSHQFDLKINNLPSRHLMVFLNALFGSYFFYHSVKRKFAKKLILFIVLPLLVYLAINPFCFETIHDFNGFSMAVQAYVFMVLSLIYLFSLIEDEQIINLFQSPEFIIVIAILFYFGTSQFVQLFQGYVSRHMKEVKFVFRYVDISIMIVYYLLIGIGLWKTKLQKT